MSERDQQGVSWELLMRTVSRPMTMLEFVDFKMVETIREARMGLGPLPGQIESNKIIFSNERLNPLQPNYWGISNTPRKDFVTDSSFSQNTMGSMTLTRRRPLHAGHVQLWHKVTRDKQEPTLTPNQLTQIKIEEDFARQQEKKVAFFSILPSVVLWLGLLCAVLYRAIIK